MEHAMGPIESQIRKHDNGRDLHPIGQTADHGLNGCRDNPCGGKDDRNDKMNVLIPALTVPKDVTDEKLIAEKLGALQREGARIVLVKAIKPGADLLWDSFYLFHGNLRSPVTKYTVDEIRADPPRPPLIGACVARDLPVLQQLYPNLQTQLTRAQFVCWEVTAQ